jgi:NAD(P)-dependent dehydrogenase (short-subunit alcohol dehydrogenase family)
MSSSHGQKEKAQMSERFDRPAPRVLVIGAQGALGSLLCGAFAWAGWSVLRAGRRPDASADFRHVDLDEPETVARAGGEVDLIVNSVPDLALTAEQMVLDRGGLLINVSALPARAGRELGERVRTPRGTVVMNAGIAPGVTNLVAADLLVAHPHADEVEMVFTVSSKGTSGRAGGDFAHRGMTALARHQTAVIPLPAPFGPRRCVGFAEPDGGWLGAIASGITVSPYLCLTERPAHRALLAANRAGVMHRLPRAMLRSAPAEADTVSAEPVAHWIAVLEHGERIAARTVRCEGDYVAAAASTVTFADALVSTTDLPTGVVDCESVLWLDQVAAPLRDAGIVVHDELSDRPLADPLTPLASAGAPGR